MKFDRLERLMACLTLAMSLPAAPLPAQEAPLRVSAPDERAYSAFSDDPHRQFDFWIGEWDVNLRMKQEDLSFRDTIAARASIYSILDGKAILELWDSGPIKGYSLRYHDPALERWVLWLDWPGRNRSSKSRLDGEFRHGRGDFFTSFTDTEGVVRHGRYSFNDITPFSLRWDDLWSKDGGKTWSKNWRMEFKRRAVDPEWPIPHERVPTFTDGSRCNAEEFRPYEALAGAWSAEGARLDAYRILDGCAVIGLFERGDASEFWYVTFAGAAGRWEIDVLDQRRDSGLLTYASSESWTEMSLESGETLAFELAGDNLIYRRGDAATTLSRASSSE